MNGTGNVKSRIAGILNVAAVVLLVVLLIVYATVGSFGVSGGSDRSETSDEDAAGQVVGIIVSVLFLLPLILIMLVPLGLVNVISGLAIGLHCLKAAPGRKALIYSLILKIVTVPIFSFAILMVYALGDVSGSKTPALFPALFAGCLVIMITAHVFEWLAYRSDSV